MQTVIEILQKTAAYFERAGIEQARLDAEWLMAEVLKCKRLDLYLRFDEPLSEESLAALRPLVRRRANREPLQHIIGHVDFYGLRLRSDTRALVPRPETEWLVERLVEQLQESPPERIADLGTGTGALALGLAKAFPNARVDAVERSAGALALARENTDACDLARRVDLHQGSWFEPLAGRCYDLIVSNPPYLSEADWESAEPEVARFDPKEALVAPEAGLSDILFLMEAAPAFLAPGGLLAIETNADQHAMLSERAREHPYVQVSAEKDFSGRYRYMFLKAP